MSLKWALLIFDGYPVIYRSGTRSLGSWTLVNGLTDWLTLQTAQADLSAAMAAFFWSVAEWPWAFLSLACFSAALAWDWIFWCPRAMMTRIVINDDWLTKYLMGGESGCDGKKPWRSGWVRARGSSEKRTHSLTDWWTERIRDWLTRGGVGTEWWINGGRRDAHVAGIKEEEGGGADHGSALRGEKTRQAGQTPTQTMKEELRGAFLNGIRLFERERRRPPCFTANTTNTDRRCQIPNGARGQMKDQDLPFLGQKWGKVGPWRPFYMSYFVIVIAKKLGI